MTTLIPKFEQTGSTTNRAFNLKLKEYLSVGDFGATGDGTTDDTTAVQTAITEAISLGKNLYFPAGQYLYTATAFTIYPTLNKSFIMFGEGLGSSLKINANNIIFNVISSNNSQFKCFDMAFNIQNTSTNNNVTVFYITSGIYFGANYEFGGCQFNGVSTAVQAIRASTSIMRMCTMVGNNTTSGALVRLWGADGTATSQDHSFSNLCKFDSCIFNNAQVGVQGYGMFQGVFDNCVFQGLNIGIINLANTDGVGGVTSSTTRCGYNSASFDLLNCWFEQNLLSQWCITDVNLTTGADIVGSIYNGNSYISLTANRYVSPSNLFLNPAIANGTGFPTITTYVQTLVNVRTTAAFVGDSYAIQLNPLSSSQTDSTFALKIWVVGYGASGATLANGYWIVGGLADNASHVLVSEITNDINAGSTMTVAYYSPNVIKWSTFNNTATPITFKITYELLI